MSLEGATEIVRTLRDAGYEAYVAGGSVRDMVMGREPHDHDVATSALPDDVARLFAETVRVGDAFGVLMVVVGGRPYEVATFRAEGPYLDGRRPSSVRQASAGEDVRRRDFTVNGLLYDPLAGRVIDLVGGVEDIRARVIRTIGDPTERFGEDRLRLLRAVRFAAALGFEIEAGTLGAITALAPAVTSVSAERLRDEVIRMLTGPDSSRALLLMHETRLLAAVLPEVEAMVGVPQPQAFHPEGDVFTHTRLALSHLRDPSPALGMGVLLHDVGKPVTYHVSDRIRFNEHDVIGAEIARAVASRLRFPRRDVELIVDLVARHMWVKDLTRMRAGKARKFLASPGVRDHLELHRADVLASHGDLATYDWATVQLRSLSEADLRPPRLATGRDLIEMGLPPGPRYGEILAALEEAQLEGAVRTREEALAFLRKRVSGRGSGS